MKSLSALSLVCLMVGMMGCSGPDRAPSRFAEEHSTPTGSCGTSIITDQETGCQYLQVCISIVAMPHTCKVDRLKESQ